MKPHSVLQSAKAALAYCRPLSVHRFYWHAMITKPFFQDVDDFGRVTLSCGKVAYQDYSGIEISKDEVNHTIQC